jgi:predicted Zn-dependent peptidase
LIGGFALALESPEAVLARSIERYEYSLPADYWSSYPQKVRAVTPEDVTRVARKYLGGGTGSDAAGKLRVWTVVVGEKSAIEEDVVKAVTTGSSK